MEEIKVSIQVEEASCDTSSLLCLRPVGGECSSNDVADASKRSVEM